MIIKYYYSVYVYENIGKFKNINKETLIYVWCHHDIIVSFIKNYFKSCLNYIDKFIFVSKWQRNRYIKKFNICKHKCIVMQNGISNFIKPKINYKKQKELIYISPPSRGLLIAYKLFQEIKKYIPNIKLKVFSAYNKHQEQHTDFDKYKPYHKISDFFSNNLNDKDKYYKNLYEILINDKQIDFYGSVPQKILFKHLETAMILFYPNTHPETCCTSILECMAYRCNILTSDLGALSETSNNFGYLKNPKINFVLNEDYSADYILRNPINYNQIDLEFKNYFIQNTIKLIDNYYSNKNQEHLNKQQEYIFNQCKWKNKSDFLEDFFNLNY